MYLKHLIIIVSTLMCASSEMSDVDEMYLNFFVQLDSVKKSIEILKVRQDAVNEKNSCDNCLLMNNKFVQVFENFGVVKKSFDDLNIRLDTLIDNSKNKQPVIDYISVLEQNVVDKKSLDDLKSKLDAMTENFKEKYIDLEVKYFELIRNKDSDSKSNNDLSLRMDNITTQLKEKYIDLEQKYTELIKNKESYSKSNNALSLRMDNITTKLHDFIAYDMKPLFDVRVDKLPELVKQYCHQDPEPTDCKTASKCTNKSGYYKIYLPGNKEKQIMVFCDMETGGGNWMHILRRIDGSENFTRPWSDYVNGFGKVEKEYWIGLENLNALTNNNGRQQLYAHLEDFNGNTDYAVYDNFIVGDAPEMYKLKSLGSYRGTVADGMSYSKGMKFSTTDKDNDEWAYGNCARDSKGGWWYGFCSYVKLTGLYFRNEKSATVGVKWDSASSSAIYYKILYLMIRPL